MTWFVPLLVAIFWAPFAHGQQSDDLPEGPALVVDPGMHTAMISRAAIDAQARLAVTGSDDKTVRIWDLGNGDLLRTIPMPSAPGDLGKVYAVAVSPDGQTVAAGGWLGPASEDFIYLFDRATGALRYRINGLPETTKHLAFSPDGSHLAATLGGGYGLRVYARESGWAEAYRDEDCEGDSYAVDFTPDGSHLATTCDDGRLRLYRASPDFALIAMLPAGGGDFPFGLAFHPRDGRLAVGYDDSPIVTLHDGRNLLRLATIDQSDFDEGNLSVVAWSADGQSLLAAGAFDQEGVNPVLRWPSTGNGMPESLSSGADTVMSILPLGDGGLLAAGAGPYLARLDRQGEAVWQRESPHADFRGQDDTLAVSFDGKVIDFGFEIWGDSPVRFDLANRRLTPWPASRDDLAIADQSSLPVSDWEDRENPSIAGEPLELDDYEMSRSLAIHPGGERFLLGTEWYLRAFDNRGEALWWQPAPSVAWATNVSGDGRLAIAAYADGTIRWHAMDDGRELLALFVRVEGPEWVLWTPEGYYDASPGAVDFLRWQINHDFDRTPESVAISEFADFHRPDIIAGALDETPAGTSTP